MIDGSVRKVFTELAENKRGLKKNTGRKSHYAHWQVFLRCVSVIDCSMRFSVEDGKQLGIGAREGTVNLASLLCSIVPHCPLEEG